MRSFPLIFAALSLSAAQPVPIIFDADLGNDFEDVLALLHSLETRGEVPTEAPHSYREA